LQIKGRAADDLQHVARRGLVFERLLQVARAVLQLVEEPRILHRDDRLRRETFQDCDFSVGKRPYLSTNEGEDAQNLIVLGERHDQRGASAG
jgi:hypothetical protein